MFINSSLVDVEVTRGDINVIKVPASAISDQIGNPKSANMVILGTFVKRSNVVSMSSIIKGLNEVLKGKQKLIAINEKALMAGYNLQ